METSIALIAFLLANILALVGYPIILGRTSEPEPLLESPKQTNNHPDHPQQK